jgi:tetratricopeptide (TPR) repeat protein
LKIDPKFAFAWDNIGICYRRLENYDKALEAYQNSLKIDPNGTMPLQNIAIVYQYKKQYDKAIAAYEKLGEIDKDNPEIYYGIGNIYATYLLDYEKGLSNMCKAYNLYIKQKSPFRTDAEKLINGIYREMKLQGKEARFAEILKENNIRTQ